MESSSSSYPWPEPQSRASPHQGENMTPRSNDANTIRPPLFRTKPPKEHSPVGNSEQVSHQNHTMETAAKRAQLTNARARAPRTRGERMSRIEIFTGGTASNHSHNSLAFNNSDDLGIDRAFKSGEWPGGRRQPQARARAPTGQPASDQFAVLLARQNSMMQDLREPPHLCAPPAPPRRQSKAAGTKQEQPSRRRRCARKHTPFLTQPRRKEDAKRHLHNNKG